MVPEGWSVATLGDCATFKSGGTPSKQRPEFWGGDVPWVSAKDLKSHRISTAIDSLTDAGASAAKMAGINNILILVRGMTLLKDVPIGLVTKPLAFNQDIKALVANDGVDPLYLSYLLVGKKLAMMGLVNTANHGTGRLDTDLLKGLPLNLPPLSEQRKIAEILSTWDRAIEVAEAQLEAARTSKRALMQQLLTGKRRFPEFEGEEWKEVRLGDLGYFKKGKGLPKTEVGPMGQFPCILYGELYTTYGEVIEATVSHTDLDDGVIGEAGDVLIPASTTTTGIDLAIASCVVKSGIRLGGDINIFRRAGNSINGAFLAYYLTHIRRHDMARFAQGITIVHLKGSDLLNIKIDVPPMEEQEKIVRVLLETEDQIIGLQSQITKLRTEKKALMQQLLTGKRRVVV